MMRRSPYRCTSAIAAVVRSMCRAISPVGAGESASHTPPARRHGTGRDKSAGRSMLTWPVAAAQQQSSQDFAFGPT